MPGATIVNIGHQSIAILARPDKLLLSAEIESVKAAVRAAQTALTSSLLVTSIVESALGPVEHGRIGAENWLVAQRKTIAESYDIVFGCFRLPEPVDRTGFEDYRRAIRHIKRVLMEVSAGLATDGLAISDLAPSFYKWDDTEGIEVGKVAGYVDPTVFQFLSMKLGSDFRRFWEEGHLAGPIHLNYSRLTGDHWEMTHTLIHEATHKFGRTWDNAYYHHKLGKQSPTELQNVRRSKVEMGRLLSWAEGKTQEEITKGMELAMKTAEDAHRMNAVQALNNADSYAYCPPQARRSGLILNVSKVASISPTGAFKWSVSGPYDVLIEDPH